MSEQTGILIVDSDDASRIALETALEPLGRDLFAAGSGEEALEQLADHRIGLVLIALELPGIDGLAVVEKIERDRPDVRVLALTAGATAELIEESLEHGVLDVLRKPVSSARIRSLARTILDQEGRERP